LRKTFWRQKPFPHHVLRGFLTPALAAGLRARLLEQEFQRKEADLFSFRQTSQDLQSVPAFKEFVDFWGSREFLAYIKSITGIPVRGIDMSGFVYGSGDYLLPHDDRLFGRRIAYVLNLSQGFERGDGGALALFTARQGIPGRIVKLITPAYNTLVLFEVSPRSFHQVDEVLADKERVSIAGWLHGHRTRT
jgi:Rps23 Pro-64 3,4-dihydroxylase Tpa1-like proline 4-hydroxylase